MNVYKSVHVSLPSMLELKWVGGGLKSKYLESVKNAPILKKYTSHLN